MSKAFDIVSKALYQYSCSYEGSLINFLPQEVDGVKRQKYFGNIIVHALESNDQN